MCPPQIHVLKSQPPAPQDVTVVGARARKELNEVIAVGPNPGGLVCLQEEEVWTDAHRGKTWGKAAKERVPRRSQPCPYLHLGLLGDRTVKQ